MSEPGSVGQIDLNLLYTFRLVSELGSVGKAAARLGRTQPAITERLKSLERDLGLRLFERAGRGVRLSAAGRAVDEEARVLLEGVHRVLDRARAVATEPHGTLRVGALPTVSAYLLAAAATELTARHPGARIQIEIGLTAGHLDKLLDGKLDVVVAVGPPPELPRLAVERLGEVRPVLVEPAGRTARRGRATLRELARGQLFGYGRTGDLFFDEVWAFLARHRLDRQIRLEVPHIQTLKELVLSGAGVTILPSYTVVEPGLATRTVEGLGFAHPVWYAVRPTSRDVPLIARFVGRLPAAVRARLDRTPRSARR